MLVKKENLKFFNKKGENLNLFYDTVTGLYCGNFVLSEKPVSVELIETEQIIVLEKVFVTDDNSFTYIKPTANQTGVKLVSEIDSDSENSEFFTFDITSDGTEYFINKKHSQEISCVYDNLFTDLVTPEGTFTNVPNNVNQYQTNYETFNIGFQSSQENSFIGKVNLFIESHLSKEKIAEIFFFVDTVAEDPRLSLLLETLGHNLNNKDFLIFDQTDVKESEIDYLVLNQKRKELLLEFHNIFPYLGSYKSLINIIKFFGYESLKIKEYWKNVKLDTKNFGKYKSVDIEENILNQELDNEIKEVLPQVYKKTNKFGLYYQITKETGEFDNDGLPIVQEVSEFTLDEVLIKLYSLKDKLKKYFLPFNSRIIDIVGEALYYTKVELNYWTSFDRIDNIEVNTVPSFEVYPNRFGFIEDLRPLEWVGAKIGPDLKLDGTTHLKVQELVLTNSFYGNTLKIFDSTTGVGFSINAEYQSTNESNMFKLYEGLTSLGSPFDKFHITKYENKILFVEKEQTNVVLETSVRQGNYANTVPVFTKIDYFNGTEPVETYKEQYLQFFFDRNFNISVDLSNNENIPCGYPILLRNSSFDVTWDNMNTSWNSLDENNNYVLFDYSTNNGFPTNAYNNGDDPFTGTNWDSVGNSNFYEIEWFVYKKADEYTPYWELKVKGSLKDYNTYLINLPYSGFYTVSMTLFDTQGTFSKKTEHNYIEVQQKMPNFTAWKIKDLTNLTWDSNSDLTWDSLNSTWDLPFLPNTVNEDALITWQGIDRIEFYQNLIRQNCLLNSVHDINSKTWNNLGDKITWDNIEHLYWDDLTSYFTKFYIWFNDLHYNHIFDFVVKNEQGTVLETFTGTRNLDLPVHVDLVNQLYELTPDTNPILSSFVYEYRIVSTQGMTDEQVFEQSKIICVSKEFSKPKNFYFVSNEVNTNISKYNTIINGYGSVGDTGPTFDIYGFDNYYTSGATGQSIALNNNVYVIPDNITTLTELALDLNTNSPFKPEWEFNIVKSYQGGSIYKDEKILAYKKIYTSDEIYNIAFEKIYGTKYARSITTNATWNSLDVLYYQTDIKPFTQVYFNYDIAKMPGCKNPKWKIIKSKTNQIIFEWSNKYMVYLFTEEGEYTIQLELEDTNGNKKTITKKGLLKILN